MNRHLLAFAAILTVGIALVHKLVQSEPSIHQYAYFIKITTAS